MCLMKDRQHREAIQEIFFTIAILPKSISTKGSPETHLKKIVHIRIFFKRRNSTNVNSNRKPCQRIQKKNHIRNGCFTKSISNTEQPTPETTQPSLTKSSTTKRQTDFKFKRVYKKTEFQPLQKWQTKKLSTKSNNNTTAEQQRSMQHYNDMPNA